MRAYFGKNIVSVFEDLLCDVWNDPDFVTSPRGMEVKEIRDCAMEIEEPMINLYSNQYRNSPDKYIAAEIIWYFSGTNKPEYIMPRTPLWSNIRNADGTVNSAYGNLLFTEKNEHGLTQYHWVIESLKRDKDTRQAFMHFNKPKHQFFENKDQVCTLQSLFHIRNNKLYMTLTMRSNDIILGFMTDWAFFSILHYHVYLQMKEYYPELEMGSYTHISHSMHLYEKHYELVKTMNTSKYEPRSIPLPNETILNEDGSIKEKYLKLLEPIQRGESPDYTQRTGNPLIDWCLEKLS